MLVVEIREAFGLEQQTLAAWLGVHVNTIGRWEGAEQTARQLNALEGLLLQQLAHALTSDDRGRPERKRQRLRTIETAIRRGAYPSRTSAAWAESLLAVLQTIKKGGGYA